MFRFQHVGYFWLLLLIPVLIFTYLVFLSWRKKKLNLIGDPDFVKKLIKGKINGRLTSKVVLISIALICLIVALANLQTGGHAQKVNQKGLDVVFALDVSNSMRAKDIKPDRLTKAKQLIYRTLEQIPNDRTGLVVFAGNAYLQVPLTSDFGAMRMLLAAVNPGMVPVQGTNFTDAIRMAEKSFRSGQKKNKVLILISDGEDHDKNAIETAEMAADKGVIIYTVGIGSERGGTILDPTTGQPMVDRNGNIVVTKLNQTALKKIANATGGRYQLLNNEEQVANNLVLSIQQLGTKNLGSVVYTDYQSYFQYFLTAALLLFLIAWFLPDAKKIKTNAQSNKNNLKTVNRNAVQLVIIAGLLSLLFLPEKSIAQTKNKQELFGNHPSLKVKKDIQSGNQAYAAKNYKEAQKNYKEALRRSPNSFAAHFNNGDVHYQEGKYDAARNSLIQSLNLAQTKDEQAAAYHNIGNTFLKQRKWQNAADAFKKSLLLRPQDKNTKYNLAYALKMLRRKKQNNPKNKKKNKKQQQQNQHKKKQEQNKKQQQKNKNQKNKPQQPQNKQGKQDKQQQNPHMQPSKLTKQQADNILNALNQEEKALHKKKKKTTGTPANPIKNW